MNMFENALRLWKDRRKYKGTTMQGRLILFFSLIVCSVILLFTLLLMMFGITGSGRQTVNRYLESELSYISNAVETDFGNLSATGIRLAQALSETGDDFFSEYGMTAGKLAVRPDAVEGLLDSQLPALLSAAENNACGGAFIILDTSVSTGEQGSDKRAGIFLKKTQPVSSASLEARTYCLRGPASLAREYGIQLLAQWRMEYEESEIAFFQSVMDTAREHPDLPLSRLFFWSDRICLSGNSENGLLLCIPLRSEGGSVWGVCGIEVSDRMFKQLYSPQDSEYQGVFTILAPRNDNSLFADRGLIAGNTYLTGSQMNEALAFTGEERGFPSFSGAAGAYGGLTEDIRLYSEGSPYATEHWAVVTLMPDNLLHGAVRGSSAYLFLIVAGLMALSLIASVVVSRRYLRPIKQGLTSIREKEYEIGAAGVGIVEIDRLFEELSRDMREHKLELDRLAKEKQSAEEQFEKAQMQVERLATKRKQEIDPEDYALFLEKLKTLTTTERRIFDLYLEGKTREEVMAAQNVKITTLKYHNRNIFGKLGVTSLKQLLQFATIMQRGKENGQ